MRKVVIGILAHVDAGKTTLAESMLYITGSIRKLGRVDHKDAFLDNYHLERARGITIFSKQAELSYDDMNITLLDTPGHADFSAEMERALQVLDYAILVINAADGVQGHTKTLWRLLQRYQIPTFLFVNKMDLNRASQEEVIKDLNMQLSDGCLEFHEDISEKSFLENLVVFDEALLDKYVEGKKIMEEDIAQLISSRKIFPCYFGSALKLDGVEVFLQALSRFTEPPQYPNNFGAKVYKILRDEQGNRLTYMKITGGSLVVKNTLSGGNKSGMGSQNIWEEKIDQIRIYSGVKYETIDEVKAGELCAVTGLTKTYPGEGLGFEMGADTPVLEPVLSYQIVLPQECDAFQMLAKLRYLEEEDPQMKILWLEQLNEIHVKLMGEIQVEILKSIILERFGVNVDFKHGSILYKETISDSVVGVGHFEPLRHYAEVHLLLEPNEPGGGVILQSNCKEDILDRNWQRLILSHLEEREHPGVLTGSPVTDIKITLVNGKAHLKHTEGGDFRQATFRAVRQGLKKAKGVLLEPYYQYQLELPSECVGRAISDIQRMSGEFDISEMKDGMTIINGSAPVVRMQGYHKEVLAFTKGLGRLYLTLKGYSPCHNAEEIIDTIKYDSEEDVQNPTGSVFCSQGTGFLVSWDKVEDYMHVGYEQRVIPDSTLIEEKIAIQGKGVSYKDRVAEDKELEEIFIRTFGPIKQRLPYSSEALGYEKKKNNMSEVYHNNRKSKSQTQHKDQYLLVDGYNIIFAWNELKELADENLDAARNQLMDILCNYQGFKKCNLILVFDAYKVKGSIGRVEEFNNIHVVYTKEAETADQYIEKITQQIAEEHHVIVATSDALEQMIILGQGAVRLSANDLKKEIERVNLQIREEYLNNIPQGRVYLKDKIEGVLPEDSK